jgi:3-deoxy-D-manno-octulosonic-acid transferase
MRLQHGQIASGLLHTLYSGAVTCALPLVACGLCAFPRGRRRIAERFGSWGNVGCVDWWVHGASVGEVQGVLPLLAAIREGSAPQGILLSATSPTGLDRGAPYVEYTRLVPVDAPVLLARALRGVSFSRFVVSETELWPNLLRAALRTGHPCHIVNGRISDYTVRWYRASRSLFHPLLRGVSSVCVADEEARLRFVDLGVNPNAVHVTGHTKYDTRPRYTGSEARVDARRELFRGSHEDLPIVTLGSIREGEEVAWWDALSAAWKRGLRFRLIVAPRHAEKFEYFGERVMRLNRRAARWSALERSNEPYDVLLLDGMGILERAYAASDIAFVGATLVDIGGHNPFEPAMYGVPVVVGPYTSVIREPVESLKARGALVQVQGVPDLVTLLERVATQDQSLQEIGRAGQQVWSSYTGASQRVLTAILQSESGRKTQSGVLSNAASRVVK